MKKIGNRMFISFERAISLSNDPIDLTSCNYITVANGALTHNLDDTYSIQMHNSIPTFSEVCYIIDSPSAIASFTSTIIPPVAFIGTNF
jgi:hypothetical protein